MSPSPATTEAELIQRSQAGNRTAADELLRLHYDRIYAICRRITGNEADALDATQDALIAIVRGLRRYDGRAAFSTWVYRVTTNACLDELRRRRRRPVPTETMPDDAAAGPGAAWEDALAQRDEIDTGLAQLPEQYRAPLVLRDLVGMDYAEIASTLQLAPGTVRSRIARGRAALAQILGGNQNQHPDRQKDHHD